MSADSTLLYVVIFTLSGVALLAIALGVSVWILFNKYKSLKESVLDGVKKDAQSYSKVIDDAKKESLTILQTAQNASKDIISTSKKINESLVKELDSLVRENLAKEHQQYEKALSTIAEDMQKNMKDLPVSLQESLNTEVQKIGEMLHTDMSAFQNDIKKKLEASFDDAQGQIETYKKTRMNEFENQLFSILQKVSRDVLQKELTVEEHEKLVVKALERAKSEGILN